VLVSVQEKVCTIIRQQTTNLMLIGEMVERMMNEGYPNATEWLRTHPEVPMHLILGDKDITLIVVVAAQPR
jgi:hypothetical protein